MVAAHHLGQNAAVLQLGHQALVGQEVVDAPPGIVLPGGPHVAPPGVGPLQVGVEVAEAVHKAAGQQLGELAPLLVGVARVADVGPVVFQVDGPVGHIHVPADDDGLFLPQGSEVLPEGVLKGHAVLDAGQVPLGVGGVHRHQEKLLILRGDDTALPVELLPADAVGDREGLPLGEDGRAGIALAGGGGVPILVVAGELEIRLLPLHFRLLQAEDVGAFRLQKLGEALAHAGPQAVYIPRGQL